MARTSRPINRGQHVRCTLCGRILSGWLPIPNRPEASMLLYHLEVWQRFAGKWATSRWLPLIKPGT